MDGSGKEKNVASAIAAVFPLLEVERAAAHDESRFRPGVEVHEYMGEYVNFRREYLVEWLIVIVLALEVAVVIADMFLNYYMQGRGADNVIFRLPKAGCSV